MSLSREKSDELYELVGQLCNEALHDEAFKRLAALLDSDVESQKFYVRFLDMHQSLREAAVGLGDRAALANLRATLANLIDLSDETVRLNAPGNGDHQTDKTPPQPIGKRSNEASVSIPDSGERASIPALFLPPATDEGNPLVDPNAPSDGLFSATNASGLARSFISLPLSAGARFWQGSVKLMSRPAPLCLFLVTVCLLSVLFVRGDLQFPGMHRSPAPSESPPTATFVARLTTLRDAQWSDPKTAPIPFQFLKQGEQLKLVGGLVEVTFDSGAKVLLEGPTHFVVESSSRAELKYGRLTAQVPQEASGFSIQTANVLVTDLGTEFALEVDNGGAAEVHVFRGEVIAEFETSEQGQPQRVELKQSEAARFVNRKTNVAMLSASPDRFRQLFHARTAQVLAAASVNSGPPYKVVPNGLRSGVPIYLDREHRWVGIDGGEVPAMLCGADYVMTRNGDKRTGNLQVRLDFTRTAHLFVLFDKRMTPPAWLSRDFIDTGEVIGLQHEGRTHNPVICPYAIWKRTVPRGAFDLGMSSDRAPGSMYGIAAVVASDREEQDFR